jgi:hypothetical protein
MRLREGASDYHDRTFAAIYSVEERYAVEAALDAKGEGSVVSFDLDQLPHRVIAMAGLPAANVCGSARLPLDLRRRAIAAIRSVGRRPEPDGITRRELPVPFRPGTLGASIDGFAIRYLRTVDGIEFLRIRLVIAREKTIVEAVASLDIEIKVLYVHAVPRKVVRGGSRSRRLRRCSHSSEPQP